VVEGVEVEELEEEREVLLRLGFGDLDGGIDRARLLLLLDRRDALVALVVLRLLGLRTCSGALTAGRVKGAARGGRTLRMTSSSLSSRATASSAGLPWIARCWSALRVPTLAS